MEINISRIIIDLSPQDYSASAMELGQDAGKITWNAAVSDADDYLSGENYDREAYISHFRDYGAWSDEELNAHTDTELRAMMLQDISATLREDDFPNTIPDAAWWTDYENSSHTGQTSGRIGRGADNINDVYYTIGS